MSDSPLSNSWPAILACLVIAGIQIAASMLLALAYRQGVIGLETLMRGGMVICGLGLAAVGNLMPKFLDGPPPRTVALAVMKQSVRRVGGWLMTVTGVVFAGLWVFAPFDVAANFSVAALGAGIAVMFGYYAWRLCSYHRSPVS